MTSQVCRDAGLSEQPASLRGASVECRLWQSFVGKQVIDDILTGDALIQIGFLRWLLLLLLTVNLHKICSNRVRACRTSKACDIKTLVSTKLYLTTHREVDRLSALFQSLGNCLSLKAYN